MVAASKLLYSYKHTKRALEYAAGVTMILNEKLSILNNKTNQISSHTKPKNLESLICTKFKYYVNAYILWIREIWCHSSIIFLLVVIFTISLVFVLILLYLL